MIHVGWPDELEVESASSGEPNLPDLVSAWDIAPLLSLSCLQ